jgi:hypothetical protein
LSPPSFGRAPRCSTPRRLFLHRRCPSRMSRPELPDRTKRSASSLRPSSTKSLSVAPTHEAGPRDFCPDVFLHEHLTSSSLLYLFPHPVDPTASFMPPGSSSPTSYSKTLTTPSAPRRRLLPIAPRATAESPPQVSTTFLAFPPRLSCSGM